MSVFLYCFREREEILRIFEMFSGQRMMTSYIRIGGAGAGAAARLAAGASRSSLKYMPSRVDEYETLLTENRIWMGRTKGVGFIPPKMLLELGITGPMLRAAGIALRHPQDVPVFELREFDFEVPTRTENDVFARYHVRVEEMRQSRKIVRQAMEGLPRRALSGPTRRASFCRIAKR